MGRGRQKAKQMKVARKLKYFSPETDLDALQRELHGTSGKDSFDEDLAYPGAGTDGEDYWEDDGEQDWVSPEAVSR